jgi:hypothetical protein
MSEILFSELTDYLNASRYDSLLHYFMKPVGEVLPEMAHHVELFIRPTLTTFEFDELKHQAHEIFSVQLERRFFNHQPKIAAEVLFNTIENETAATVVGAYDGMKYLNLRSRSLLSSPLYEGLIENVLFLTDRRRQPEHLVFDSDSLYLVEEVNKQPIYFGPYQLGEDEHSMFISQKVYTTQSLSLKKQG